MYELVTISFSHYCEKARWALDLAGVRYRETPFMPALHLPYVAWKLRGSDVGTRDSASSRYSTPLLSRGALRVSDSREIARYVDTHHGTGSLFAPKEAEALDREYAEHLGPHTRRVVYYFGLARPSLLFGLADAQVDRPQAVLFRAFFPVGRAFLRRALQIDERGYRTSLDRIRQAADKAAARLADGRPYLCGEDFSVADLGFASMMAPAVFPPEYGVSLPLLEGLEPDAQEIVRTYREHPAGEFTLRMYREHRRPAEPPPLP